MLILLAVLCAILLMAGVPALHDWIILPLRRVICFVARVVGSVATGYANHLR